MFNDSAVSFYHGLKRGGGFYSGDTEKIQRAFTRAEDSPYSPVLIRSVRPRVRRRLSCSAPGWEDRSGGSPAGLAVSVQACARNAAARADAARRETSETVWCERGDSNPHALSGTGT